MILMGMGALRCIADAYVVIAVRLWKFVTLERIEDAAYRLETTASSLSLCLLK